MPASRARDGRGPILLLAAFLMVFGALGSAPAGAASSRDYPGPCSNEAWAPPGPIFLSADYHGQNPSIGFLTLPTTGRIRLGISCVATGYVVVKVGADSALCTVRGRCSFDQLMAITEQDIEAIRWLPGQVPFYHICQRHGFGWYDAVGVAPGFYLAIAKSGSAIWGLVDGHGTADTYPFYGNNGAFQPVNCAPPGGKGDGGGGGGGDDGGGCGTTVLGNGDLLNQPCLEEPPVN